MIYEIIEEVAATSSKNKKLEILKSHADNVLLKRVIKMAYDPFLNFWIKKIPMYETDKSPWVYTLDQALDQLMQLAYRTHTGNAAIAFLIKTLENVTKEDAEIIIRVISKDLRAGFSAGTSNKVWPDLVMEYPCMLCSPFEERLVEKISWPAILQLKMDGLRFNAIVKNETIEYRTRNGKLMDLLGSLDETFWNMAAGNDFVFDGELLVLNSKGFVMPRQTGNGILVKAQKGTLSEAESKLIAATLWDMIPAKTFAKGTDPTPYKFRFGELSHIVRRMNNPRIRLVESTTISSMEECMQIVEGFIEQGLEGAILKDREGPWEDKRVRHQIKFKGELDCDLICTGWEYGTGKNAERLGALVLESSDGKVKTSVGSGFTDADRDSITSDVIRKIVTVKYNARISKKGSETDSLFLPIFKEVRLDKQEADSSNKIK